MRSWQSTRPSVSTVLTKFPLYWTMFIQKYYIHREQRWRIKLHLEEVSSWLRVKTNRMVKNNRNIVSSLWLRLEMRKTRIQLLWCIQYYVSQKNLVKLITRYTQSVNGMGPASFMLSTHWHRMWHICNSKLSNRCIRPCRHNIFWNKSLFSLNVGETWLKIKQFSCKKLNWKMTSAKWWSFCSGLNVFVNCGQVTISRHKEDGVEIFFIQSI